MRLYVILFVLCLSALSCRAQKGGCISPMDSAGVIQVAREEGAFGQGAGMGSPSIKWDENACEWTVRSSRASHRERGRCKRTNGCTVVTTVTLIIDGQTQKVKRRKKKKTVYPNYE